MRFIEHLFSLNYRVTGCLANVLGKPFIAAFSFWGVDTSLQENDGSIIVSMMNFAPDCARLY